MVVSEDGVENEVVFGPIELQRRIKLIFFLLLPLFKIVNRKDLIGRLQVDVNHLLIVSFDGLLDIEFAILIIVGHFEVVLTSLIDAFITSVPFDRVSFSKVI